MPGGRTSRDGALTGPARRRIQRYGWAPDLPDVRDHQYAAPRETVADLPPTVDLRDRCPAPVYDQGQLGACSANAIAAAVGFDLRAQGVADFSPSRLFLYYNERAAEGTTGSDCGGQIRDGIKSVAREGLCRESDWPYDVAKFADKPSDSCYTEAQRHRVTGYQRIPRSLAQFRGRLASGYPFVFGFTAYESFEGPEVARTGVVPLPTAGERVHGGHAALAVGYDDAQQRVLVRNSWGEGWGMGGYFTLPYAYLTERSLSADFWAILSVAG